MRTQGTGEQVMFTIGLQDQLFGKGFGMRIVGEPARRIRRRFVDMALIAAGECDAGTTGKDEPRDAATDAAADDVVRAARVRVVEPMPWSPNAGDRGGVKDD